MKKRTWFSILLICLLTTPLLIQPVTAHASKTLHAASPSANEVIRDVPTSQKLIALSFDDGPSPIYTPKVLALLKKNKAKATFFVIGSRVVKYADLVKRESDEGHEVANHSFCHQLKRLSDDDLQEDLAKAQEAIYNATGQEPRLYRPPGGMYNKSIINAAIQAGFQVILWSSDPRDWSRPGVQKIVQRVMATVHNGDIILLHDNGRDRSQTIQALEQLLPQLEEQGYRFVTISELLQTRNKRPAHKPTP